MTRPLVVALLLLAGLLVDACHLSPSYQPPPVDGSACASAEDRIRALQCTGSKGQPLWQSASGVPLSVACVRAAQDGRAWPAACIAAVPACSAVPCCYGGCQ